MSQKKSEARRLWWASLSEAEKAEINLKRSQARQRYWASLTPEEKSEFRKKIRESLRKGKKADE